MPVFLLVGVAGAIGALLRYSLSFIVPFAGSMFPLATVTANLVGSFLLGLLAAFFSGKRQLSEKTEAFLYTGLIGSFTTFSTFSVETISLIHEHAYFTAIAYVIVSAVGGLFLAMLGFSIGRRPDDEGGTTS